MKTATLITRSKQLLMDNMDINKDKDFTRVNSDMYGNPRYVIHFLNINDDYDIAVNICKSIGGARYHNKQYGGGIVFQSYSLIDTIKSIKLAIINNMFDSIINEGFDLEYLQDTNKNLKETSHEKTFYKTFLEVFISEYGYNLTHTVNSFSSHYKLQYIETIKSYLQGLPTCFNCEFRDFEILELLGNNQIDIFNEKHNHKAIDAYFLLLANRIFENLTDYKLLQGKRGK